MAAPKGFLIVPVGFRADGTLRALELTDSDELKVAIASAAAGLVGPHGWIGDAWQKNPLQIGYSARISQSPATVGAGENPVTVQGSDVPAGEIWIAQAIVCWHTDPVDRNVYLEAYDKTRDTLVVLDGDATLSTYDRLKVVSPIVLAQDDYIIATGWSIASGSSLSLGIWGMRIDIDQ